MTRNQKKRLLVLTSTFPRWKNDTIPPFVYELSKRLTNDFDVYVLAPHFKGAKKYEIMDGMKVYRFQYFPENYENLVCSGGALPMLKKRKSTYLQVPFFFLAEFIALLKLVRKIKPDVIHAHWIPQGFVSALVKKITGTPYILTSHGGDIMKFKGFVGFKKYVLENAQSVTVVSNALKKEINTFYDSPKIKVIPMGVDSKLFNPNKRDNKLKEKYGIKGPFLLFVGRLAPEKGVTYLLKAMPKVLEEFPNVKLMIIGEGPLRQELEEEANNLKINNNVIFTGGIENKYLPKYYATADVFVGPSLNEPLGLTFVEAGMSGCFLIGTNVGGIPEVIKDKLNGRLVNEKNKDELAETLISVIKHKTNGNGKYRKIAKRFDWETIKEKYISNLNESVNLK